MTDNKHAPMPWVWIEDAEQTKADSAERDRRAVCFDDLLTSAADFVQKIDYLIDQSEGITGLCLSGDFTPWSDARYGGPLGSGMEALENLRAAIAKARGPSMPVNPLSNGPGTEIRLREPPKAPEECDKCPECGDGTLEYIREEGCSCHISAPCGACTSSRLTCPECGWKEPEPEYVYEPPSPAIAAYYDKIRQDQNEAFKRGYTFPHGGRVFEVTHDGRSGSTHVIKGRYEGPVTRQDIIDHYGEGTFGHLGPALDHGTFTYTKITD